MGALFFYCWRSDFLRRHAQALQELKACDEEKRRMNALQELEAGTPAPGCMAPHIGQAQVLGRLARALEDWPIRVLAILGCQSCTVVNFKNQPAQALDASPVEVS